MEVLEALNEAGAEFVSLVDTVGDDGGATIACGDWSASELLEHVTGGCRMTVALMDGATAEQAAAVRAAPIDGAVRAALAHEVTRQLEALTGPDARIDVVHHPITDIPPQQLAEIRLVEFLVHRWDLSMAFGVDDSMNAQHAAIAWAAMEPLAEIAGSLGVFGDGPSGELDASASALHRLLDLTGRRP